MPQGEQLLRLNTLTLPGFVHVPAVTLSNLGPDSVVPSGSLRIWASVSVERGNISGPSWLSGPER